MASTKLFLLSVLFYLSINLSTSFDIGKMYGGLVAKGNIQLHYKMFGDMLENAGNSNFVYSPYMILSNLALLGHAAQEETETSIKDFLDVPATNVLYIGNKAIADSIKRDRVDPMYFDFISYMWIPTSLTLKVSYDDFLLKWSDFQVQYGSTFSSPSGDVSTMNTQANTITYKRIPELFPPDSISYSDSVVIGNGMYFKPKMDYTFQDVNINFMTKDGTFIKVPGMEGVANVSIIYIQNEALNIVVLPVLNGKFKLLLIDSGNIDAFIKDNTNERMQQLLASAFAQKLEAVQFPKFRIEYSTEVKDVLSNLGLSDMFDVTKANFSDMVVASQNVPYISKMYHKGIIHIDNEGASGVVSDIHMYYSNNFGKQFGYMLIDAEFDTILLAGKVDDPQYPSAGATVAPSGGVVGPPGGGLLGGGGAGLPPPPNLNPTTTKSPDVADTLPADIDTTTKQPGSNFDTTTFASASIEALSSVNNSTQSTSSALHTGTTLPPPITAPTEGSKSSGIQVSLFFSLLIAICPVMASVFLR